MCILLHTFFFPAVYFHTVQLKFYTHLFQSCMPDLSSPPAWLLDVSFFPNRSTGREFFSLLPFPHCIWRPSSYMHWINGPLSPRLKWADNEAIHLHLVSWSKMRCFTCKPYISLHIVYSIHIHEERPKTTDLTRIIMYSPLKKTFLRIILSDYLT